jgi:hypothetical protein
MSTPAMRAKLALHLLVLGVLAADDPDHAVAPDDLAVLAHLLDRSSDFHSLFTFLEWLLEAFHDSAPSGVVGGHLDLDPVPGKESQVTPAHTP